jgi:hypothetical protein
MEPDCVMKSQTASVQVERRRHPRFMVGQDALLYNHNVFAEILDISMGGVACQCLVHGEDYGAPMADIDLLDCDAGKHVKGLSCRLVRDREVPLQDEAGLTHMHTWFLEFTDLSEWQREQLARFIANCSQDGGKPLQIH